MGDPHSSSTHKIKIKIKIKMKRGKNLRENDFFVKIESPLHDPLKLLMSVGLFTIIHENVILLDLSIGRSDRRYVLRTGT